MSKDKVKLKIIEDGNITEYESDKGITLLEALKRAGIFMPSPCGGIGKCGKCKIAVAGDYTGELTEDEERIICEDDKKSGYRLACKVLMEKDITINKPAVINSAQKVPNKDIFKSENKDLKTAYSAKKGIAVDIGTTTVVICMVNLDNGEVLDTESDFNKQAVNGTDVISRIQYVGSNDYRLTEMKNLIISQINRMIYNITERNGENKDSIVQVAVSGNTTMLHFFLGLSAEGMGTYPYTPVITEMISETPEGVGIDINSKGNILILPSVSAFIGADILSGIIASGMYKNNHNALLIDLGTNGEIVLWTKDNILACSTAVGPAFEGCGIEHGITAVNGAVEKISIDRNGVQYSTIGDAQPIGICGSGIIDITAEMLKAGIIDRSGRMASKEIAEKSTILYDLMDKIIMFKNKPAFKVINKVNAELLFTQEDVRQVQLAKSAVAAGVSVLMKKAGIGFEAVDRVYLAGNFGNYINLDNAVQIGLIPKKLRDKIITVGNSSVRGAVMCLKQQELIEAALKIKEKIKYCDLNSIDDFEDAYINNLNFK